MRKAKRVKHSFFREEAALPCKSAVAPTAGETKFYTEGGRRNGALQLAAAVRFIFQFPSFLDF
ncbi:MAG: hypothetical protein IJ769_02305 [Clostridia bacterium]|nr:hypothetical protein [Clostridia bacterium]